MENDVQIGQRLAQLVDYKTNGKRNAFAEKLGWSKQYLNKLLHGESVGIAAVRTIITAYPDVSARWLITGQGCMLEFASLKDKLRTWLQLEEFIPAMTAQELAQLEGGRTSWSAADFARWRMALDARQNELNVRISASMKNAKICK